LAKICIGRTRSCTFRPSFHPSSPPPLPCSFIERASTRILGDALAAATGGLWIYFAGFLGALGSFFSGSNTISNLTFGPIQLRIAQDLGVSPTTMLALQTVGAAMGNMVAVHNIVAVCAVLGLKNQEGFILRKTFIPTLMYGIILAALAGIWLVVS
jgi:lactate permease